MKRKSEGKKPLVELEIPNSLNVFALDLAKRYKNGNIDESKHEGLEEEWRSFNKKEQKIYNGLFKKAGYVTVAAGISIGVFIGLGFVSPAVAQVISKIPALGSIIEYDDQAIRDELVKELRSRGYKVQKVIEYSSWDSNGYFIHLTETEEDRKITEEIKKVSQHILKKYHKTKDYFIKVQYNKELTQKQQTHMAEQKDIERQATEVMTQVVDPVLKLYGNHVTAAVGISTVDLNIPKDNPQTEEIVMKLEKALKKAGKDYKVNVYPYNLKKNQQYSRWGKTYSAIFNTLQDNKDLNVSGFGFKSENGIFKMFVTIKLNSNDPKAKTLANEIRKMIDEFIATKEIQEMVKDDPYEVIVKGKNKKVVK